MPKINGSGARHILFIRPGERTSEEAVQVVQTLDPDVHVVKVSANAEEADRILPELFSPMSNFSGLDPIKGYVLFERERSTLPSER